jgi:hypothetical protein
MNATSKRFWSKVAGGQVDECWLWTACLNGVGYGRFGLTGAKSGYVLAHRWAYEQLRGDIPEGLVLDHLCRTRNCVNPWHLEPVSRRVNALRGRLWESEKTHCAQGHPFDETNTRLNRKGHRVCRTCAVEIPRRWRERQRQRALGSAA